MGKTAQHWQSQLILLLVVPYIAVSVLLDARTWLANAPEAVIWIFGLSLLLGLVAWKTHAATAMAAATGSVLNASMMFSTMIFPYRPWGTALVPVLTLLLLTSLGTRYRRTRKEGLGVAEARRGRGPAQVAANLGLAALVFEPNIASWISESLHLEHVRGATLLLFAVGLASLAEAAADTVSSELGQVLGDKPRMITTLRVVPRGTDGAISLAGTFAGLVAAATVAASGTLALHGSTRMFAISFSGAVFGLFFDSLLGATVEGPKGLNNDSVNFLSTISAAAFACVLIRIFRG